MDKLENTRSRVRCIRSMCVFLATYFETNGHFDSNVKLFPVIYANYRSMTDD